MNSPICPGQRGASDNGGNLLIDGVPVPDEACEVFHAVVLLVPMIAAARFPAFAGNDEGCSGVARSDETFNSRSFPFISAHSSRRCGRWKDRAAPGVSPSGTTWGLNLGPIWPWLASFTPSGEAENEAGVASFGASLTRTRWASRPWLVSSGVRRSGKLLIWLHSVAFGCISYPPNPHPDPLPEGEGIIQGDRLCVVPSFARTTGAFVETTHATNVGAGAAMAQWAFVVDCRGVLRV